MLRIWGRANAFNVHKAVWAAEEADVPYERVDAGRQWGKVDTPEFRQLNPNGLVPVIEDGDYVLWESNTIVRYICGRYGRNDLYPSDFLTRIEAERWMDWQATEVMPAHQPAFNRFNRGLDVPRDVADASVAKTNRLFGILDAALSRRDYVAGDHFTMGDMPIALIAHRWLQLRHEIPDLTHVRRWYARIAERAPFRVVAALPTAGLPQAT
jgi:glutathione S-transferase